MKYIILIAATATFAPGCISQKRIAERLQEATREVNTIVAPYVIDTFAFDTLLPPDTLGFSLLPEALKELPDTGRVIQTPTHQISVIPIQKEGRTAYKITAVKRPERVTIKVPAPRRLEASAVNLPPPAGTSWLSELWLIVLAIIAFIKRHAK